MHVLEIYDTDELYRRIPSIFIKPDGILSSAAFQNTSGTDDMSVDLGRLTTTAKTAAVKEDCYVARFFAGFARSNKQEVLHTPIIENYAHSSVRGKKTQGIRKKLAKASEIIYSPKESIA